MAKTLRDIPTFTKQFWKGVGDEVADRIRVHTTKGGKDVEGRKFSPYTANYKARKGLGKYKRQSSTSTKVDLQLTGDMNKCTKDSMECRHGESSYKAFYACNQGNTKIYFKGS